MRGSRPRAVAEPSGAAGSCSGFASREPGGHGFHRDADIRTAGNYGIDGVRQRRIMIPPFTYFTFVETKTFERLAERYLSDGELSRLEAFLSENPYAGSLIPESGGVRKVRWAMPGRGKQGGMRIIYYVRLAEGKIWLLTLYPKNVAKDISVRLLRKLKEEIDG